MSAINCQAGTNPGFWFAENFDQSANRMWKYKVKEDNSVRDSVIGKGGTWIA